MNKYKIKIEREAIICNLQGEKSEFKRTENFQNKENRTFIKTTEQGSKMTISTPECENIKEAYIKLEEITDILLCKIYENKQILWAYDKLEEITAKIKIEIKQQDSEKSIIIDNITLNPDSRCGITKEQLDYIMKNINSAENIEEAVVKIKQEIKKENNEKIQGLSKQEILKISIKNTEEGYNERYSLRHYPKLVAEAVVIIKDALSQGIDYKILNEKTSVVEFNYNGHKEIVIEGNKTDRDSYIFPIITDDKLISKNIMKNFGLNVPKAVLIQKNMEKQEIEEILQEFETKKLVVKPRNTNMGTGITVFSEVPDKSQLMNAIEYAFKFDEDVLIEEYIKGMEYRFLVIDGKCISIAHRRAASIVGDGKSTIKELIDMKNKEPWHALTKAPVKMDEPVEVYLKLQGYTYDTILENGRRVFLRTNSNCSTGGESVDMTEIMPEYFKQIAEKAAKAFDAKIAGVDLIIEDMNVENYSIIEINDNPGYSINEWPYEGKGEDVGISILKMLGY